MQKFRKKPVVVEAVKFTGGAEAATPIIDWVLENGGTASWHESYHPSWKLNFEKPVPEGIRIETLEGTMNALVNDWIIKGVKGEFYSCKPDIFEVTYEPIKEDVK